MKSQWVLLGFAGMAVLGIASLLGSGSSVISRAASFIMPWEGFSAHPYWDVRQWSIGYGTGIGTDRNNKPNVIWSQQQAYDALVNRLQADLADIRSRLIVTVPDSVLVALLSFNYNLGIGNTVNIIDRLNVGKSLIEVAEAMQQYVYAGGAYNSTLVRRRGAETDLFV
jgi:GH24 family phage-related lysozyme (muramidase)